MKKLIEQLKVLNKVDVQLRTLKKDIDRLPKEKLPELQNQIRLLRVIVERGRAEITRLKMDADGLELEVKTGEEALKRLAGQMNVLRTSKEFETVRRQMDAQRGWNRENEGKTLELLEKVDAQRTELAKNETALAEMEKTLAEETQRVDRTLAEWQLEVRTKTTEREALAKDMPEPEMLIYNRIVQSHGDAIARVDRGICSACFMKLPAQIHNLALLARDLVCCPSCGRILTATYEA